MSNLKKIIENINNKNFDKALKLCKTYENNRNSHIIFNLKGSIHFLQNNYEMAEKCFLNAIKIDKNFIDPIKNLYIIYQKTKNYNELLSISKKLIELDPTNPSHNYKIGFASEMNDMLSDALKFYQSCIELDSKEKKYALNNIGNIYLKKNKLKKSIKFFLDALSFDENDKIIVNNVLKNYLKLKDEKNIELFYKKAEKIDNNFNEFLFNKIEYFIFKNQINDAIKILETKKNENKFLLKLIKVYLIIGKNKEAKILLDESKEKIIKNNDFNIFLGTRYLYEGDFENGWKYYEFRLAKKINFLENIKEWNGEDLNSKKIAVINEQGIGDAIQFSKYILPLLKISQHVTFIVQKKIQDIFRTDITNLTICDHEKIFNKKFDYKITLGSLIKYFYDKKIDGNLLNTKLGFIEKWRNEIDTKKINVGLVWSGSYTGANQPYRSVPLKCFGKLLSLDLNFYCLQNEIWERDLSYFKSSKIIDYGKYNLKDICSIIQNLDLVISVDTSLLHLSASLNKETWGILDISPEWRWGKFNLINPYKSLKLFHQKRFNDWEDLEKNLYENLKNKIKNLNK